MRYDNCPVLLAEPELGPGPAARTLAGMLASRGLSIVTARSLANLRSVIAVDSRIATALLNWDLFDSGPELASMLDDIGRLNEQLPVVLLSERADEQSVPPAVAERAEGYFWLHADSPRFVAGQVERLVRTHALMPEETECRR